MAEDVDSPDDLKSQRPKRRKQAEHVAMPWIGEGSACHPNRARVSALLSMYRLVLVVGSV